MSATQTNVNDNGRKLKKSRPKLYTSMHYAFLSAMAFIAVFPIFVMVHASFKRDVDILSTEPVWFFIPTLNNYNQILFEANFLKYLGNSLFISIFSTFFTLLFGCMAAYALVRFKFMGKGVVSTSNLLLRIIPPAVLVVPVYFIWSSLGFSVGESFEFSLNNKYGIVILYTAINLPFAIWILQSFIVQVPYELEESARIDGANPLQVFLLIVMPLIKPGLAAAAIFTFRIAWNEFILALAILGRADRTLPIAASLFLTDQGVEWGRVMAMGTLIALPPLVFTFFAAKQIIAGLTAGSIK